MAAQKATSVQSSLPASSGTIARFVQTLVDDVENVFPENDAQVGPSEYDTSLPGWDTSELPPGQSIRPVLLETKVPSPLALGKSFVHLSDAEHGPISDRLRLTYNRAAIAWKDPQRRAHVRSKAAAGAGVYCLLCSSSERETRSKIRPLHAEFGSIVSSDVIKLPSMNQAPGAEDDPSDTEPVKSIQVYSLTNQATGNIEYFVMNPDYFYDVSVNGVTLAPLEIAGPLPSFAVVEVEDDVLFWWRNHKTLLPEAEFENAGKRKRKENASGDVSSQHIPKKRKRDDCVNRVRSWLLSKKEELNSTSSGTSGSAADNAATGALGSAKMTTSLTAPQTHTDDAGHIGDDASKKAGVSLELKIRLCHPKQLGPLALQEDEIVLAIGSVWAALRQHKLFGYGNESVFGQQTPATFFGETACGQGSKKFIIPLMLPSAEQIEAQEQDLLHHPETVGHFILMVALKSDTNPNHYSLQRYDSFPHIPRATILEAATNVVQFSNWLGLAPQLLEHNPFLTVPTPRQQILDSCGIYTILNAWAVMLDIAIHPGNERRETKFNEQQFIDRAREVIDLALAGCIDMRTIRWFLHEYGYSAVPQPEPEAGQGPESVDRGKMMTVAMRDSALADAIEDQKLLDDISALS
ncbi:MAG: hypothetical protein Q9191_007828 [Dirinaria sp. TL-2023a]